MSLSRVLPADDEVFQSQSHPEGTHEWELIVLPKDTLKFDRIGELNCQLSQWRMTGAPNVFCMFLCVHAHNVFSDIISVCNPN